ncbi:hypothetical protein JOF56_004034 [Kibdelosporangium banguiense]|uniref:MBL fold metallo-hydrolase n=1 Tax=Kibdelosporangium banguiense TaxID=1365924 RepID=A0ABS4TI12_9PSEU|nr:hypothetical protein [Kibdelosporangium banguiense]MBP2323649.1 hypothetical protein [Kibdelosporangium banguiense]
MTLAEVVLQGLADEAKATAPRLFAICGVRHDKICDGDTFIAWGIEFDDPPGAVLWYCDGTTFGSDSASQALRSHQIGADARLIWLGHGSADLS